MNNRDNEINSFIEAINEWEQICKSRYGYENLDAVLNHGREITKLRFELSFSRKRGV